MDPQRPKLASRRQSLFNLRIGRERDQHITPMNTASARVIILSCFLVSFSLLLRAANDASPPAPDAAYIRSFERWKALETDDLKQNWLPLAGLFWLKQGVNSFGSDGGSSIVFPKGPACAGEFNLAGEKVTAKFLQAAHAMISGKAVTSVKLDSDISGRATEVEMGSLRFHVIARGQRVGIRLKDLTSPNIAKFKGMVFFPLNLNHRITARWEPSGGKETVAVPNVLGDVNEVPVVGTAIFRINGTEMKLTALSGDPAKGVSFIFSDLTSKTDTYPGGRFLDTDPVTNGTVVLDFNRAYNPPCAVTPYATCPLALKENWLAVAIPAGEKFDKAAHAHP
jgi:uncharacterized protein